MTITENELGLFTIALGPCTVGVVSTFLPDTGVTVWVRGYRPEPNISWWNVSLPLRRDGSPVRVQIRDLEMDLQFSAESFRAAMPEFEDRGVDLYLMSKPVPPTLTLHGLDATAAHRVLMSNGLIAHFDLPHAGETAVLAVSSRDVLDEWLRGPLKQWIQ